MPLYLEISVKIWEICLSNIHDPIHDSVFRGYDCVLYEKIVVSMQHNLQLILEELPWCHT